MDCKQRKMLGIWKQKPKCLFMRNHWSKQMPFFPRWISNKFFWAAKKLHWHATYTQVNPTLLLHILMWRLPFLLLKFYKILHMMLRMGKGWPNGQDWSGSYLPSWRMTNYNTVNRSGNISLRDHPQKWPLLEKCFRKARKYFLGLTVNKQNDKSYSIHSWQSSLPTQFNLICSFSNTWILPPPKVIQTRNLKIWGGWTPLGPCFFIR